MKLERLQELEQQGLITLRTNSDNSLFIANYTPKVQFEKLWTEEIMQCRGLIVDKNGKIIARPFRKLFNIEEWKPEDLPNEPFDVYEKLDGSLGILYFHNDEPKIATRGSFDSEQAIRATKMLQEQYSEFKFNRQHTYLFEIIYPENRIVVDYGKEERLVLLAVFVTEIGSELDLQYFNFPDKVVRYDGVKDLSTLRDREVDNKEGFVVRFRSGLRVKMKYAEYVRLHRIITQVSNKSIWEYLRTGQSLDEIIERVPDEFYEWVKKTRDELIVKFCQIDKAARLQFLQSVEKFESRKQFAEWATQQSFPHLLFALYDNKPIADKIWMMIKPKFEKPFKEVI